MIVIDIIIIIVFLLGIYEGWKKGTLTSLLKLIGSILIFVLAFYLKGPVTSILVNYLPFISFGGIFEGITSFNIVLYEGLAFFICVVVLSLIFKLILKLSGGINKLINATIILGLPNKLLGALLNLIRYYIITFIVLFIATLIPITSSYIKETTLGDSIVNQTPILSNMTKNLNSSINDIYNILKDIDSKSDKEKNDAASLEILLKYDIITPETARKLNEAGKLKINNFEEIVSKYENNN